MFPNATFNEIESLDICPLKVDKNMNCPTEPGLNCMSYKTNYCLEDEEW